MEYTDELCPSVYPSVIIKIYIFLKKFQQKKIKLYKINLNNIKSKYSLQIYMFK